MRRLIATSFALAAWLGLPGTAVAADIVGRVMLSGEPAPDAVVSIEGLTLPRRPDETSHVIDHHDLAFDPHVLVVSAGTAVRFKNSDGMPCRIYSISPNGWFVLRRTDGPPMTVTFTRPGVIEVRCADHDRLLAYIIVKENPFFAVSDASGRYVISAAPPGRYIVQVWYEGAVIQRTPVEIGTGTVTIDVQAARPAHKGRTEQPPDFQTKLKLRPTRLEFFRRQR